ncbi:glycosyltransferase family A protein [Bradyrhizobium sp. UFLA05-109]
MVDPTVSAIIIVYNGAEFLRDAIDSIVVQTLRDWELIVVDDGSTDESASIAEEYVTARPQQIRLVQHADGENHGTGSARNLGVANARGKYIGFLDADDVWLPNKLEEQLAILKADASLGMVYGRTTIWYSPARGDQQDFHYDLGVVPDRAYAPPHLFENLLLNVYQTPTTCNALMPRNLAVAVGGFDPDFEGMFEDQAFFAKIMLNAPVFVSDRVWAKYRQHPHSLCAVSEAAGEDATARLRFLRWVGKYLAGRPSVGVRTWKRYLRVLIAASCDVLRMKMGRVHLMRTEA